MNALVRSLTPTTLADQETDLAQLSARIEAATHRQLTLIRSLDDREWRPRRQELRCVARLAH